MVCPHCKGSRVPSIACLPHGWGWSGAAERISWNCGQSATSHQRAMTLPLAFDLKRHCINQDNGDISLTSGTPTRDITQPVYAYINGRDKRRSFLQTASQRHTEKLASQSHSHVVLFGGGGAGDSIQNGISQKTNNCRPIRNKSVLTS